ncbi:MAG: PIN domain protein [Proteobacteria bacterium]|nr:PIN domain protein [Pseudomonadota bacterium]
MLRKLKIYIDTSVIGGCLDDEFKETSNLLINKFKKGEMIAMVSELTILEIRNAPQKVRAVLKSIPEESIAHVELNEEAVSLAKRYIAEGVINEGKLVDAEHIAIATINSADILVSWNFKHIVNLQRIHGYNSVNLKNGYPIMEIRSPREVVEHEE